MNEFAMQNDWAKLTY